MLSLAEVSTDAISGLDYTSEDIDLCTSSFVELQQRLGEKEQELLSLNTVMEENLQLQKDHEDDLFQQVSSFSTSFIIL